jgi:hypothetical protein
LLGWADEGVRPYVGCGGSLRLGRLQGLAGEGSFAFAQDRSATTRAGVGVLPISFAGLFS